MKKFMIFLLMTILYLGTCQARSEASYPKDANLKLLSWVSPTPSQSFLTRSNATGTFDITPSSTVHLGVTSNNSVTFSRPVDAVLESLPGWPAGATVNTVDWKVDGSTFKTGGNTCVVEGLNVGNHTFNCELKLSNGDVWTSNTVNIVVAEENIMLTIVGATQACESDVVTLTAVINGQVQGHTYQWKVDGEAIPGATGQTYSFIPDTLFKTAIENENLSHEFTVEVNRDGCLQTVSPIHPFVILLKPEITLNFPEFVCENSVYNIDASLSGFNSSIQPYQWKWFKNNTLYATTSEATLSLEAVEENLNAEWAVYALFEDLACATDTAKMKADTVKFYEGVPSTFTFNLTNIEDDHHICVNSVARYQASAQVLDHSFDYSKFENATYKWYVNNELVATTNSDIYEFSFPVSGQYLVSVVAIYDNYPCTEFTDSDEMVVDDIPEIAIVGNNVICAGDTTLLGVVPKWEGGLSNDFIYFYNKVSHIDWFGNNELLGTGTPDPYNGDQIGVLQVAEPGVYVATVVFDESACAASAEFTVTQFGADLQVSASEMLVCPGTTVTLNANVDGWNNENIKYEWNTGETSSTISAVVDRDSVFTVTASAGDNCSLVQTINVKAIPAENIQLTVKAEVDTICVGGRVKATIENADPDYQGFYTWYLNGFEVAGSNLDTIFFDVNNAGIYSVAATLSNFSCGADTISAVDTFVVVGGNTLVLAGDNVVCPGDTAVVIATKIDGAKYTWLGPNVENANNDTLRTAVPGIYVLTVEDTLYGCPALTADFTINQIGADLQVYASDVLVCPGTKVTVRANLDGFSNWNVAYAWSTEDTTSAAIATVSTDTTFVVTAFVTAPNSNNVCSLTDSINVFVYDTTSVQLVVNATPENICQGSQVNLKVRPIITSDATVAAPESYIWYINGVEIPGQNLDSVILSLNEPGSYEFSVRPANQVCKVQPATYAQTPVTVYAIPDMYIAGDFVICTGDTAYLAPIIQPADDKFTFTWNTGSTDSLLKVTEAGVYHVYALGDNGKCYANASFSVTTFGGDLHVSADRYSVCESEMVVLTANLDGMQNENIKYAWSQNVNGTVSPLDTTSTLQVYPTETTTYIVTAIAGNCSMVDSVKINVSEGNTYATTVTFGTTEGGTPDGEFCAGQQNFYFKATSTPYFEGMYKWFLDGNELPGENFSEISLSNISIGVHYISAQPIASSCDVVEPSAELDFRVHAAPQVTLTGNQVICSGDTAKILANATTPKYNPTSTIAYSYTYSWNNNDNDSLLEATEAGVYAVTVTDQFGCSTTETINITTFGGDLHVSADKYVVCESEMVVLTANLDGMQNENIKYAWSQNVKGTVTPLDTTSTLQVYPTDTTTYIVTAIAGNCSMVDSVTVNVINTSTTVNITVSALEDTVCVGGQATLSVASTDNHSYVWYQNGIVIPGENLSAITVNLNEPGMYVYAATPANTACVVSSTEAMDTIWVFANPEVALTGNSVICNGDTAKILATVLNGNPADYTYLWSNNDNDSLLNVVEAGIYTVTVTNKNTKCEATADVAVTTFGGDLHVSADKYSVCESEMVVLTANLDGMQNENIKYAWSQNVKGTITNLDTTSTLQVYPTDTTTYIVTAIAGNCSMVDSVTVNVILTPTTVNLTVSALEDTVCVGGQATLSVASTDNHSYVWYQNGIVIPGENLNTIRVNLNEPGMYVYAATPANTGCVVSTTEAMDTIWVFANPEVYITGDHFYTVNGDSAILFATKLENCIYVWSNGATTDSIVVADAAVYTVTVTDTLTGCSTTVEYKVDAVVNAQVNIVGVESACMSDVVTLTAVVDHDLIGVKYQWLIDGQYIPGATGQHYVFKTDTLYENTGLLTHDIQVEVTREGCEDLISPVHKFSIRPVPMAVITAPEYICEGDSATFVVNVYSLGSEEEYQYAWFQDNEETPYEDTISYINTKVFTTEELTGHSYGVKVLYQDTACASSVSEFVSVKFYERPAEIQLTVNADTVCEGAQIFYTLENVVDTLIPYINWFVNGVQVSDAHDTIYSNVFDNPGDYHVYAKVAYEMYPCEIMYSNDTTVHVFEQPTVQITGDPIICADSTVSLFAMINDTIGSKKYNYEWRLYNFTLADGDNYPEFTSELEANYQNVAIEFASDSVNLKTTLGPQDHPYIFTTEITTEHGCVAKSEPYFVYVGENLNVAVTVDYDTVCKGGEVTATAHIGNYNWDNLVYQWYENDTLIPHGTSRTYTTVLDSSTVFTVVVKQTTTQCEVSGKDSTEVITPKNIMEVLVVNNGENVGNVCEGAQLEITAYFMDDENNPYIDSSLRYVWTVNGMSIANYFGLEDPHGPSFSHQAYIYDNDTTDYVYSVYVVHDDIPGCHMSPVYSDTVTVRRNPVVTIDGTPNVCYFDPYTYNVALTAWVDGVQGEDVTYRWFESGQLRPNVGGADNRYRASWPATYDNPWIFTVEVGTGNGCTAMSEPFYVNVYEKPVVNITSDADSICEGGNVTLNANLDNYNDPMLTFQWYENVIDASHKLDGYTHEVEVMQPSATTDYIVTVTHLMYSGSSSNHSANQLCWSADTFKVQVNAVPQVDSITNNLPDTNVVCDGYQLNLAAHISNGVEGGEVYTWYRNGEIIAGATGAEYTEVLSALNYEPTQYTYAVSVAQSASGCQSTVFTMNTFTVNPNPVVELTTDPIVCVATDSNIMLVANVYPAPETEVKFNWFENNSLFMSQTAEDTIYLTKPYRDYPYNFSVQLVNEYGCSAESSADVYVNANPVVNITATETEICDGPNNEITLSASLNDWNADMLTFQWYDNDTLIPGATELHYTVAPARGTHYYTVKIDQLTSLCSATSDSLKVVVSPRPVITSVDASQYTVCYGAQIAVSAHLADTVAGETFTWYRNGILLEHAAGSTIYDAPGVVDNNTQTYVYEAFVTRPAAGCTSLPVASETVTVYPNPTVVITGDQHVCETDSVFLIANVDTIGHNVGNLHYTWYESGMIRDNMGYNLGDNHFFAEYLYARTEPYRFTVEVRRENDATGCVARSEEFNVYVYTQPVVNITATETDICTNGEVTLTANLNDYNATDLVYQWYEVVPTQKFIGTGYNADGTVKYDTVEVLNRVNIPGATQATFTANVATTTTFGVMILQTPSTCTANDEITINVNPIPVVTNVTVNSNSSATVCDGAQVTIAATINPADAEGAVYTWYRNGEEIAGVYGASFDENVYTTDNHVTVNSYTAIVTLPASGCVSTISDSAAVVTVNPRPTTVTISGNNMICFGDSTVLTAYSDVDGKFIWSNGVADTNMITVGAGVYTVTMKTAEGCEMTSAPFTVESLGTDLLVSASETSICQGEHTTLYVNQDGWNGNVSYQWDAQAGNSVATTVDVTPDSTTTYKVTATVNNENGSCSAVGEVTIVVTPRPVVDSVVASASAVCEGTQVTFTAYGNGDSYIWYHNGYEVPGENQNVLVVNFNEEGSYSYSAKAVNNSGCVSAQASTPVTVVVNAAPESVVITGQTVICDGGSTTLFANVIPNTGNITYEWFKDNVAIANSDSNSLVVSAAGSYKVSATTNNCTTTSDAVVVTVEQTPTLQLTATETTICVGGETVITAELNGYNNPTATYSWTGTVNNGTVVLNGYTGSSYSFQPTVEGTYKFVVTGSQSTSGCVATDSINITVNNIPMAPAISVTNGNSIVCDGGQVNLSITNAVSGATYTWFENDVVIPGATNSTLSVSPVSVDGDLTTYSYKAIATLPASGCVSYATPVATIVTVIPTPEVAVSVNGNTTLCAGGTTTLNANVTPAGAGYSYQWYQDNVLMPNDTNSTLVVSAAARETAYNYHVVVSANAGCTVASLPTSIVVKPQPSVVATVLNDTVCVGGTTIFTAEVVNGGVETEYNNYTYKWYNNLSTTTPVAETQTFATSNLGAGTYSYWVVVESAYGCESTSNNVAHVVVADPTVTVAVAQGYPATVCDGGQTTLIANVSGGNGNVSYQWYKNNIPLYGETNMTLETEPLAFGAAAAYTVVVSQSGVGCESVSAAYNVNVVPAYTVTITGSGNVCEGGTLTLTANVNNKLDGDNLTYQWYKVANGVVVPVNGATQYQYSTSDILLNSSYDYFVVVTSGISGCSVESETVPVNVVAAPSVTINGASSVCAGGDLVLNAQVSGGVAGAAYQYIWNWTGAENGADTVATASFVPALNNASDASAPYYFTVTVKRADNTGCTATSAAHRVDVNAVPSVVVTADNAYICAGGDVTFTAHVSPVGGTYNYKWTVGNVTLPNNSSSVTVAQPATGTVNATVVVTDATTSAACNVTASLSVPVQVVGAPVVSVEATHYTMCVGGTTKLTATVANSNSNISNNYSYQWQLNGFDIAGATDNTFVQSIDAAGAYNYTVKVTHNGNLGCTAASTAPVTVLVAEQPSVSLSSLDGLAICEGGSITLTGVVDNWSNTVNGATNKDIYGALTFDWYSNGLVQHHNTNITNSASNQVVETLNNVGNYSYQVVVTPSGYNCQPQASNINVVNVVSNPSWTDVHVYSENGTDVCLGETVTLMASIQGGVADYSGSTNGYIQWTVTDQNNNTMNVGGGLGGNSYDIPSAPGTYIYTPTFVGNIGSGCQLTNTAAVQQIVTVHELPTATFASGDGASLCLNDPSASAELVINFTGVAPFVYVVKDNQGNPVAQGTTLANNVSIYVQPTEQTTYFIDLVADAYCQNTALESSASATVYVKHIEFDETFFVSGCNDNGEVTVDFTVVQGNPTASFTVVYANGLQASGNISNNTATFAAPSAPGDYPAVITIDGCSYDITVRVLVGEYGLGGTLPIMDQRWNDVVVVNNNPATNGGHTFVGFQWYKNGVAIPGATFSNYQDKGGLNGFYSVELIEKDENGNMVVFQTCEAYFNSVSSVKAYPVPANVRQEITIELDLTSEELEGAILDIYSVTGAHIRQVTDLQPITKIGGFQAQGTYFGRILTGTNEIKTVKFVIVK